jgi:hypothetical protein
MRQQKEKIKNKQKYLQATWELWIENWIYLTCLPITVLNYNIHLRSRQFPFTVYSSLGLLSYTSRLVPVSNGGLSLPGLPDCLRLTASALHLELPHLGLRSLNNCLLWSCVQ